VFKKLGVTNRTQASKYVTGRRSFRQGPSRRNDVQAR